LSRDIGDLQQAGEEGYPGRYIYLEAVCLWDEILGNLPALHVRIVCLNTESLCEAILREGNSMYLDGPDNRMAKKPRGVKLNEIKYKCNNNLQDLLSQLSSADDHQPSRNTN
jgi:hypothetical protein